MSKHYSWKYQNMLFLIFFSIISLTSFGQGFNKTDWRFSNPKQFGFTVLDVDFFDNTNVIAVGSDGGIAKSTDGGSNWTYGVFTYLTNSGLVGKGYFNDVHFITSTIAYAVGNDGLMIKSTDAGVSWTKINTPLSANGKIINTCFFVDANKGYIGGENNNTIDSLPKLYVTNNGGSSWDSIAAPVVNGVTRGGYINNPNIPSALLPVDAKMKQIYRIEISSNGVGYICGQGSPLFPAVSLRAISTTNCLPATTNLTTGAHTAALLWKLQNGSLTDYSLSKERLGYSGINTATINCTTGYGNITPAAQTYRAMNIINDSTVVLMSFNNNTVVKVRTGVNDKTANVNNAGALENGKYEVLNYPFPPTTGPDAGPPIPNPQVLLASNPYQLRRTSNGTLVANGNFGRMWISSDTGRNWKESRSLPPGQNFSSGGIWALDIAPNGKFLSMGSLGITADSIPGGSGWNSNYITTPLSAGFTKMEFADCNNGTAAGSSTINVTRDGGNTWIDRGRPDFANSFYSINGFTYRNNNPAQSYYAVSNGTIYYSGDTSITLDPVYADGLIQMNDIATVGKDSVWAIGYSSFSVPTASRTSKIYRSFNAGATWSVYSGFSVGSLAQNLTEIEFPTRNIGYAAGNRDTIYKTTDAGVTWIKLPLPNPGVTPQITYKDMFALDANTVFLVGNGFPRKVVLKTSDGGNTWTDISNNITSLGVGNLNSILMHDANNGYIMTPGLMCKTTNGGASWTLESPPTGCLFETAAFAPKNVPSTIAMSSRKLFVTGVNVSGAPIMEYGNPSNIFVNASESLTASCTNGATGSIVVTASGGIAPYTYSLNGGTFQTSNVFNNESAGTKTITIKDAYCGILTKTVIVGSKAAATVNAGADKTIVAGDQLVLQGSSTGVVSTIAWSPNTSLTNPNTFTPLAKPTATTTYTLTVTDNNSCIATDNVIITVIPYCVKVMDAFTPNGDGINDKWLVTSGGACTQNVAVRVFNRYGETMYSNNNYQNDWNGTYKGKPVADGTYYYIVTYKLINGSTFPVRGDVTILR